MHYSAAINCDANVANTTSVIISVLCFNLISQFSVVYYSAYKNLTVLSIKNDKVPVRI